MSTVHPLAGQPVPPDRLADIPRLVASFFLERPGDDPAQRVSFGTSGHRGSSLRGSFNEEHIVAIAAAICEYRAAQGIEGPLFLGADSHALSEPARMVALEVLVAAGVEVVIEASGGYTPTPVISREILRHNAGVAGPRADGIVITPSHNPPEDGGFKYNPPHGGPAGTEVTGWIQRRANELLESGVDAVRRRPWARARAADNCRRADFVTAYVADLARAIDFEVIATSGLRIGADPMGGSSVAYWAPIAERYGIDVTVVNERVDPTFGFMHLDHDGRIRMDCSSPHAMAGLLALKDRFDIAFGNDTDADRHGIVTPEGGLMNPNHYLAVAIDYLFGQRTDWPTGAAVGKTLVSSSMIDRVTAALGRELMEVPVGFKWFVEGLLSGRCGFGGEESAGASFLCRDGSVWTTDKDGILLDLLAAEITARTGQSPAAHYRRLTERHGEPVYARIDAPATPEQKQRLKSLSPEDVSASTLAGDPITARLSHAPGNGAPIGGLKVTTDHGWFAARPSGTEDVYKIYAESFRGTEHLAQIQEEARAIVDGVIGGGGD